MILSPAESTSLLSCLTEDRLDYATFETEMVAKRRQTAPTQKFPISVKTLVKFPCRCIRKKKPGECDCHICTIISVNSFLWGKMRSSWWRQNSRCVQCQNALCFGGFIPGCDKDSPWRMASRSMEDIERFAMCEGIAMSELATDDEHVPTLYHPRCVAGLCDDCPMKQWAVGNVVENGEQRTMWKDWQPRWAYNDKESGQPVYKMAFVDCFGTRKEFTEFWISKIFEWLPHRFLVRQQMLSKKRYDFFRPITATTKMEDFAAQLEVQREATETCGQKEKHNECVSVVGHSAYNQTRERRKWKSRVASTSTVRKQHVDVFFGFSPVGEKPATRYHITMQLDIDSFLKTGKVLYGEWFYKGKRLPGGDHSRPLPDGVEDWEEGSEELAAHILADYDFELEITDGCSGQYDGHSNHHQTAVWLTKTGICKQHVKNVKAHGKCACDGASNVPKAATKAAIADPTKPLQSGTRELVLYLAKERAEPEVPKAKKHGWWSFDCYFYGFYDPSVFARVDVPEAKPLSDSRKLHDHIGMNPRGPDGSIGSLYARWSFCACDPCLNLKFADCLVLKKFGTVDGLFGEMKLNHCPRTKPPTVLSSAERQLDLAGFARSIAAGRIVALRVEPERRAAGSSSAETSETFALAFCESAPSVAKKDMLYAGEPVTQGWWIVSITWFDCIDQRRHVYRKREKSPFYLVVAAFLRIGPIEFERETGGRCYMSEDTHAQILAAL